MLSSVFLFLNIGGSEMILILFAALMLFGGNKLPELARGLGKGIRDFKDASEDVKREINNQINNYEDKKVEKKEELAEINDGTEPAGHTYEPVAGTLPAFEGQAVATDAIEQTEAELKKEAAEDDTFEHHPEEIKHPVTGSANRNTIDLTKGDDEPVKTTTEEEYK
ncbi:twin-arginine translocase TatA/TatE family subunit [Mucilaginibacter terrigena]|uniref:Sec-independent protein translocase protein TatA n=1 Tax=Mucilaginibacter terrigena TaxID=2492395 RepID=A0A4Q5LIY5_9SPHI|nr:twin-arginine translocase TatA/TatE family subunit [Mucilaginibacter terrigena]RYU86171.1 twin-arginine translocase TatA/TatE family subunit [Mucilaginibacter terrigena]